MDLSFFQEPPERAVRAVLTVDALAPLSMVASQPGSYFRSQPSPTDAMLYGMLENALGLHLPLAERKVILKALQKQAKKRFGRHPVWAGSAWLTEEPPASESGYFSLLTYHLAFDGARVVPDIESYDDLWAFQRRDPASSSFFGGSRHYDAGLEKTMTRVRQKRLVFGDRAGFETISPEEIDARPDGAQLHFKSVRDRFPQYYVSPTPREYILPKGPYRIGLSTTPRLAEQLMQVLADPVAPLYLGSSDGWVEAHLEVTS